MCCFGKGFWSYNLWCPDLPGVGEREVLQKFETILKYRFSIYYILLTLGHITLHYIILYCIISYYIRVYDILSIVYCILLCYIILHITYSRLRHAVMAGLQAEHSTLKHGGRREVHQQGRCQRHQRPCRSKVIIRHDPYITPKIL